MMQDMKLKSRVRGDLFAAPAGSIRVSSVHAQWPTTRLLTTSTIVSASAMPCDAATAPRHPPQYSGARRTAGGPCPTCGFGARIFIKVDPRARRPAHRQSRQLATDGKCLAAAPIPRAEAESLLSAGAVPDARFALLADAAPSATLSFEHADVTIIASVVTAADCEN